MILQYKAKPKLIHITYDYITSKVLYVKDLHGNEIILKNSEYDDLEDIIFRR